MEESRYTAKISRDAVGLPTERGGTGRQPPAGCDLPGEREGNAFSSGEVGIERGDVGMKVAGDREAGSVDESMQLGKRQVVLADDAGDGIGDRMPGNSAAMSVGNGIAPPLQADLADHGIGDGRRNAPDFGNERGKRDQCRLLRTWREEGGDIAIRLVSARNVGYFRQR